MAFAVLVVDGTSALKQGRHSRRIERRFRSNVEDRLDLVEQEAAVSVRPRDPGFAGVVSDRQRLSDLSFSALNQLAQRVLVEPVEDEHLAAGQKRGIEFE